MSGSVSINPAHYLLGPRTGEMVEQTEKTPTVVRMPGGATYDVTVRLEKWQRGRPRGRKRAAWTLVWDCPAGIPVRNHAWKGDDTYGGGFPVSAAVAESDQWAETAAALIAEHCVEDRARYDYRAPAA